MMYSNVKFIERATSKLDLQIKKICNQLTYCTWFLPSQLVAAVLPLGGPVDREQLCAGGDKESAGSSTMAPATASPRIWRAGGF